MISGFVKKIFGTTSEREIKQYVPLIQKINSLESAFQLLSDESLKLKTSEFKSRLSKGETLDSILPEAFAVVREAGRRVMKMRHYDVQLIGGIVLHRGKIAEMKTGEGKTLVATLPLYLNALAGKGAHLVTVNDYLAKRDAEWMKPLYEFLGLSVGIIVHGLNDRQRQEAYACDITYGTNNEFGFDYLRDNMKVTASALVQRDLHFAIVDEVDSILIDEARTPLIISGPTNESSDKYRIVNQIMPFLKKDVHYTVDEKARSVLLTDEGVDKIQQQLNLDNLYDPRNIALVHHVDQALRAHVTFKRDVDYVVRDGEVIIVDEFTGRLMPGRRYSDGLHQALEAKEGVTVATENQTLASISFQNYFRMYSKLGGMTGTADTEAEELGSIYGLEVVSVPTHRPMVRIDQGDIIFKNEKAKLKVIVKDIRERHQKGQPVLVGTVSIEKSERLSEFLKREGVPHVVLNAKQHEREAEIIKNAGQKGTVTIATNMAGRGTDIVLGEGVREVGGLYILGTERHESRRIDNQLRGRAGRQGDPGESRFYLSLEDDLLRIFGGERMIRVMGMLGMEEDEPIEAKMISNAIEDAQMRVEGRNFDIRKHLLKYDDVANYQRKIVYAWRKKLLIREDLSDEMKRLLREVIEAVLESTVPEKSSSEKWIWEELVDALKRLFGQDFGLSNSADQKRFSKDKELFDFIYQKVMARYEERRRELEPEIFKRIERMIVLHTLDDRWKEHLLDMDHLREGINLRGYAQKDPILDYQKESFALFQSMFAGVKQEAAEKLFHVQINIAPEIEVGEPVLSAEEQRLKVVSELEAEEKARAERAEKFNNLAGSPSLEESKTQTVVRKDEKVGRNDVCPCGSGKKYKKCHGQ